MYDTDLESYNDLLQTYFDEYYYLSDAKKINIEHKYDPTNKALDEYNYSEFYEEKSHDQKELDDLPPLQVYEEKIKTEKD